MRPVGTRRRSAFSMAGSDSWFQNAIQRPPGRTDAAATWAPRVASTQCQDCAANITSHGCGVHSSSDEIVTSMPRAEPTGPFVRRARRRRHGRLVRQPGRTRFRSRTHLDDEIWGAGHDAVDHCGG